MEKGKLNTQKLPNDRPPTVAYLQVAVWPWVTEAEIGTARCATWCGTDLALTYVAV